MTVISTRLSECRKAIKYGKEDQKNNVYRDLRNHDAGRKRMV